VNTVHRPTHSNGTAGTAVAELLLADGRFPGGSFVHSGGLEAAIGAGAVPDGEALRAFVLGRLHHGGPFEAWLAARACAQAGDPVGLARLEAEAEAAQPSPALRAAARAQGRGLRRAAAVIWPVLHDLDCEVHPVVLGAVGAAAGLGPAATARLALYGSAMTIAGAAVKLAAFDMADALAVVVALAPDLDALAAAAAAAPEPIIRSAPLTELRADRHRAWEVRLFAS